MTILEKKYYILIILLLGTLSFNRVRAQVTADFIVHSDSGCVPFIGGFMDASIGNITYRHWDFGNGNVATGNNTTPSAVYNTAGVYDVTLTVSDGLDTSTITKTAAISVFSLPVASFNNQAILTGCANFPFNATNTSTPGSIPIESWEWDFDDGSPIVTGTSVSHLYTNPGTFNVTLIITDSLGCSSSKVKSSLVNVKPKPVANFYSNDSLSVCGPPLTVNIINSSTSTHPLIYNWLVGGVSYNTLNVTPTFTNSGGYDAQLIVTSTIGCADTLTIPNYVWIGSIVASMNIPDTVCIGTENEFYNTSFGGHVFDWDFGDGTTGVGDTVSHVYNSPGQHMMTLVASSGSTCDDTVTQTLFVEEVHANFSSTPHYSCQVPMGVNFTDLSIGNITSWEWRFGNLLGSSTNPKPNISTSQHPFNSYDSPGVYDDTLIVTSQNGCMDTMIVVANEEIIVTQASWSSNVTKGCAPLLVDFTITTDSINRVASWWWDYGDGSPIDYTFAPSHTFTNVGVYNVTLYVVSIDGCTTLFTSDIKVGALQTANFMPDTLIACASDTITFTNLSTDTSLITEYVWFFGDGKSDGAFEPWHLYEDTGYMDITLVVEYNGCPDTLIIDSGIYIMGPIVNFYPTYNCDSQNVVTFNPNVVGGTNFTWNFGDDSTYFDSLNWSPSHPYPILDSNYRVELTVWDTNSGCSHSYDDMASIRYLVGKLSAADTTICRGDNIVFNTGNSINAISFVRWGLNSLNNPKTDNSNTDYTFPVKGPHTVYAIIMDFHGCTDTVQQDVYVYEPDVQFTLSPSQACAPSIVQFTDLTQSDTNIMTWNWDLGNGSTSTQQNPTFTYNGNGTTHYDIVLTVTDTFGCVSQFDNINAITVIEPPSFFNSTDVEICEYNPVSFSHQPVGNYSYHWDFDDGSYSTLMNPIHQYTNPGVYDVSLTVTDSLGCDSTYVRPNFIDVQDTPDANFEANPAVSVCYPASITFTDLSTYQNVDYWTWNFGDSPNDVILYGAGAQNLYNTPGYYDVTMVVTTTFGCADTIVKNNYIHIGGPTGKITHSPATGCANQDVMFVPDSLNSDAKRFIWDFGDGVVDTTIAPNSGNTHTYLISGYYNVSLLITDQLGLCQVTDTLTIEIDEVTADYLLSDSIGCSPLSFDAVNNSIGEDVVNWYLDGNSYSQAQMDSFYITASGLHEVTLVAKSNYSQCADTITEIITVHPNPNLNISPDAVVCIEDSITLHVDGAQTYQWQPPLYLSSDTSDSPLCVPISDITYFVTGTDSNNCQSNDSINVIVQQKPVLSWITPDTSIFIGTEFQLNTLANMPLNYLWTPKFSMGCSDCSDPYVKPNKTTTYTLVYKDLNGCFVLDTTVTIEVLDEFKVTIPNTFTPGGDNLNDTFIPVLYGVEEMLSMRIFDRWGTMVYETNDITQGWDGTFNGQIVAHNSAFSYTVRVRRFNGEIKDFVGVVIILTNGL